MVIVTMDMETLIKPNEHKSSMSKTQMIALAVVLVVVGAFFFGRQYNWFGNESVAIPSGAPYAEARVIGAYEGIVLAERVAETDADGNAMIKKLEILTDEKTVFAKLTSSGPVKISYAELSEGDVIWVYNHVRSLEETLAEPADPELAIPFEDMAKNPRERIKADFVVLVSGK